MVAGTFEVAIPELVVCESAVGVPGRGGFGNAARGSFVKANHSPHRKDNGGVKGRDAHFEKTPPPSINIYIPTCIIFCVTYIQNFFHILDTQLYYSNSCRHLTSNSHVV